ncbi:hypothetical protein MTR_6g014940 [Medicago truncatula]|uniref:Uncharacterized protein n=1 Tax=Medicago truncatula TaxID=3880 RepID=G7KMD0_MEDTR|nr:hypothetical protein MTR_6g014940 [Medicago truncatula]
MLMKIGFIVYSIGMPLDPWLNDMWLKTSLYFFKSKFEQKRDELKSSQDRRDTLAFGRGLIQGR